MSRRPAGLVLALVATAVLCGAPVAAAQVRDPPEELWRDFPLSTRTEVPPAVPPAQVRDDRAAAPTGTERTDGESGDGTWWLVGVGIAAGSTIVAWVVVRRGDRRRRRAPAEGGRGEVVASRAIGTLYEIVWRDDAFELVSRVDGTAAPGLPRSRATPWRASGPPPNVPTLRAAHRELCATARDAGWAPAGMGDAWYARRFRAPARVLAAVRAPTTPVQIR